MLITPHTIAVRSIREAMACGCPVTKMQTPDIDQFVGEMDRVRAMNRGRVRTAAETLFNPAKTAQEFLAVVDTVEVSKAA